MNTMIRESKVVERWPMDGAGSGLSLLGEWYGCGVRRALLEDAAHLRRLCLFAAESAGLRIMAHLFHQLSPSGVAGTILLAESHLAIHTWPDERSATLDVFVGTRSRNNRAKARAIYSFLRDGLMPDKENFLQVARGGIAIAGLAPR